MGSSNWPLRVARADMIAIVNRGGDYPVHAARQVLARHRLGGVVQAMHTACGKVMFGTNRIEKPAPDCLVCRRVLGLTSSA